MNNTEPSAAPSSPRRLRPWFLVGILLFVVGPVIYALQFYEAHLTVPWYAPILATIGVALMALSAWQRRGRWRVAGLIVFVLVCGLEWFMVAVGTQSPAYAGPVQVGRKLPAFATTLADGRSFSNQDLETGSGTLLLFFRGRW